MICPAVTLSPSITLTAVTVALVGNEALADVTMPSVPVPVSVWLSVPLDATAVTNRSLADAACTCVTARTPPRPTARVNGTPISSLRRRRAFCMSFFTDALRQPIVQAPLTASLSRIDVAVTAPVLSVEPFAHAHRPTFSAEASEDTVFVIVAEDPIVTVTFDVVAEGDAVAVPPPLGWVTFTTKVSPETDSTVPETPRPKPPRCPDAPALCPPLGIPLGIPPPGPPDAAPLGMPPPLPPGAPEGMAPLGIPDAIPPPGWPPLPAPLPPPNAVAWHWPLTGSLIVMLDAVTFPDASPAPEAGDAVPDPLDSALRTLTHTPAFRSAAVPDACRVIVVVSV